MSDYTIYKPAEDTFLVKRYLRHYARGNTLEIGTGSGELAKEAAKYAKKVLAVDIQKPVITHCKKTIKKKNITFKHSDLFSNVKGRFDLIFFNPPYLPDDSRVKDIALDGGPKGYELIERFIIAAPEYLKEDGKILLLFSNLSKKNRIDAILQENCLHARKIAEEHLPFFEILYLYLIDKPDLIKGMEKEGITKITRFAKGKRGIVFKGMYTSKKTTAKKPKEVIIKAKNPRAQTVATIQFEAEWLAKLNKEKIGPKLLLQKEDFLVMEYLQGEKFHDYCKAQTKAKIIKCTQLLIEQMHKLDELGVNKQEMTHPHKHIIIKKHKPILIDFERCRYTTKPKNVTQFIQFITSTNVTNIFKEKGILLDKKKLLTCAKAYKQKPTKGNYTKIYKLIKTNKKETKKAK